MTLQAPRAIAPLLVRPSDYKKTNENAANASLAGRFRPARQQHEPRSGIAAFEHPVEIIRADEPDDVDGALAAIRAASRGLHAAGFFAYELGYVLEPKLARRCRKNAPCHFCGLASMRAARNERRRSPGWLTAEAIGDPTLGELTHTWDSDAYLERFEKVQDNIRSGDIYQLNLTFKAKFKLDGSPLALYRDLRLKQRVAYGGLVDTGDGDDPVGVAELSSSSTGAPSRPGR